MNISRSGCKHKGLLALITIGGLFCTLIFYFEVKVGVNFGDEGYLLAGSELLCKGWLPIRDFQAYDPGRYFWNVLWGYGFDDRLFALRFALFLQKIVAVSVAAVIINKSEHKSFVKVLWIGVIVICLYPRHKIYEPTISLVGILACNYLIIRPSIRSYVYVGIGCGIAAFIGRNHGLYWTLSILSAHVLLAISRRVSNPLQNLAFLIAGSVIGFSPMLILFLFSPNYFGAYFSQIQQLMEVGSTNLSKPIPWPWIMDYKSKSLFELSVDFSIGSLFLLLALFVAVGVVLTLVFPRQLIRKPMVASSLLFSATYIHYGFSRPDVNHLAQGMMPFLIGIFALSNPSNDAERRWKIGKIILASSVMIFCIVGIGSKRYSFVYWKYPQRFKSVLIEGNEYKLSRNRVKLYEYMINFGRTHFRKNERVFFAPNIPIFYSVFDLDPPVWFLYMIFPLTDARQLTMISNLETSRVNWAVLGQIKYDGRNDLEFRRSHNRVNRYILQYFEPVAIIEGYTIFKRLKFKDS